MRNPFRKAAPPPSTLEIRDAFNAWSADEEHFPSTIDPRIYHVQFVVQFLGDLAGKRVLDVGSGKGRFARVIQEQSPGSHVYALDLSEAMLRFVPPGVGAISASMTLLPFASDGFDCGYAIESLEHAIDIEKAVAEICRVVKPGGRIVVIDKNVEHWGKLQTPRWEKWFGRKELELMLRRHCRQVESRPISYWEDIEPDGLFLAWTAEK